MPDLSFLRLRDVYRAMRLVIRLSVVVAAVASTAVGQHESDPPFASCTNAVQRIELIVVARSVADGSATPSSSLIWVIKEMPSPDKVVVCEQLKPKIMQSLARTAPGPGNFQVADGTQFDQYLMIEVDGLQIELPGGINTPPPPTDAGKEFKVILCVTTDPATCIEPRAPTAEIQVATATGRASPLPNIPDFTVGASIPVKLFYSDEDLAAARKDPSITSVEQAHARVRSELLKVAGVVYAEAVKSGGLGADGRPVFDSPDDQRAQTSFGNYDAGVKKLYSLKGGIFDVGWSEVKPNLNCRVGCLPDSTETPVWVWSVEGLRVVEGVNIEVIEEDWETPEVQGSAIAVRLRERRQKAYDTLNGPARPALAIKPGYVATRTDVEGDLALLKPLVEAVDKVKSGPVVTPQRHVTPTGTPEGRNIIYAARRKKKPELILALTVGGSYSKEDGGTGRVEVEEVNLLRLKETITLSAEGGEEVQKYRFSFTRAFERSDKPRLEIRDFSIDAQVFKDKDRRLGNLTKEEIAAREVGSSANLSFGYDSVGASDRLNENCITDATRKRTRYGFLAAVGLNYHDVNIPEDDELLTITGVSRQLLPRERTQTTTLSLDVDALLRHDFREPNANGLGVLELRFGETAQKGFHLFGADYEYWKSRTVVSANLTFGFSSFRDMFVLYRHGHERASEGTPIFELPLLGGAESVRGLEAGEFIGRRVSFDQFEVGLNVASVWNFLRRKGRLGDSPSCPFDLDSPEPTGPFDFKNLYIKGFFDYGRLADSPVAPSAGGALRRANGYGVALELRELMADESGRRVNLSIGYGRSPHSRLHRSGMVVTGVTLEF